jgi:DNA-directed RNA polymerase subunit M/transcription elongation factor TFIIS
MRFCDRCGTHLREKSGELWCPKCKTRVLLKPGAEIRAATKDRPSGIYVVNRSEDSYATVSVNCPACGNEEAYHWYSSIAGEHAGIRRERTIEHFKCTRCAHAWSTSH